MLWWWIPIVQAGEAPVMAWEVGAGVRNSVYEAQLPEGAHVIVRRREGPWSVALKGYARLIAAQPSSMDETLVRIAQDTGDTDFARPVDLDQQALALLAGWHPWPLGGTGGAPVLYAGVEGRRHARYWLEADNSDTLDGPESGLYAGPVLGAGFEVEAGWLVSRLVVSDRMLVAPPMTYDRDEPVEGWALHHAPTISLDVLVRLGGQR